MCQPFNLEVPKHYLGLFAPSTYQFIDALATLASMVKLVEGDDMRQLRIEVCDMPAYFMDIEECMNVEVEVDG